MKLFTVVVLLSTMLVTSCAKSKWVNETDSSANYKRDTAICENEAIRIVPPEPTRITVAPAAAQSPKTYNTNCSKWGDETNCTTTSRATPQATNKFAAFMDGYNKGEASGGNGGDIKKYTNNCMALKGWIRVARQ